MAKSTSGRNAVNLVLGVFTMILSPGGKGTLNLLEQICLISSLPPGLSNPVMVAQWNGFHLTRIPSQPRRLGQKK